MHITIRLHPLLLPALFIAGCGGGSGMGSVPLPISVSLAVSTVTLSQDGAPVTVPIHIVSTSETGTVAITGLPTGVKETYAASDTNPSGTLMFVASAATPAGTYKPTITVNSAGQTATTTFTLIITAASSP